MASDRNLSPTVQVKLAIVEGPRVGWPQFPHRILRSYFRLFPQKRKKKQETDFREQKLAKFSQ